MTVHRRSAMAYRDERDDGSFVLGAFVALVAETVVLLALFVAVPALLYVLGS